MIALPAVARAGDNAPQTRIEGRRRADGGRYGSAIPFAQNGPETRRIAGVTYSRFKNMPPLSKAPLIYIDDDIWAAHPAIEAWWREQEFYIMVGMIAGGCKRRKTVKQLSLFEVKDVA